MLQEIFIEFPRRIFHVPAEERQFKEETLEVEGTKVVLAPAERPLLPGHVAVKIDTDGRGTKDISRLSAERGAAIFAIIERILERVGKSNWLIGSFGWLSSGGDHVSLDLLPDPWHVPDKYAEETDAKRTYDPLTDVIMDGLKKVRRFQVQYGDAHMSGALIAGDALRDFMAFKRLIGAMRTEYGKKRDVLYPQRHALLEMGRIPSIGYHILAFNYNEVQLSVIPRLFVPKREWTVLDLFYNAEVARDLHGRDAEEFWEMHTRSAESTAKDVIR